MDVLEFIHGKNMGDFDQMVSELESYDTLQTRDFVRKARSLISLQN